MSVLVLGHLYKSLVFGLGMQWMCMSVCVCVCVCVCYLGVSTRTCACFCVPMYVNRTGMEKRTSQFSCVVADAFLFVLFYLLLQLEHC